MDIEFAVWAIKDCGPQAARVYPIRIEALVKKHGWNLNNMSPAQLDKADELATDEFNLLKKSTTERCESPILGFRAYRRHLKNKVESAQI